MRTLEKCFDLVPLEIITVLRPHGEYFLPNLNSLALRRIPEDSIPSIPSFLSPKITSVAIRFAFGVSKAAVASVIKTLPTLCPNLRSIDLHVRPRDPTVRPRDPMITAAISEMLLATNKNILQQLHVRSPLTEEANEVICKLPNLRDLWVTIDGPGSLPTFVLPNLTTIDIEYDDDHGWLRGFHGATLGKLTSILLHPEISSPIGDFLGAFESIALTTSITETLSEFRLYSARSWRPKYRSLLPFTQLKELEIALSCGDSCSSTVDDSIITDLARAMPKLEILQLGAAPCQTPASVTVKGLAALAYHCPRLIRLCIHFQLAGLDPREIPPTSSSESTIPQEDCALAELQVGDIHVPEESALMVALTLLRIFPRLGFIRYTTLGWVKVAHAISVSKELVDRLSKSNPFATPRSNVDVSLRTHIWERHSIVTLLGHLVGGFRSQRHKMSIPSFRALAVRFR